MLQKAEKSPGLRIDAAGFCAEMQQLRNSVKAAEGLDDILHLQRIERRGRIAAFIGAATAWMFPNPITALLISYGQLTRWLLGHHILHKGYDQVPGIPDRYTSKVFARGWRRYLDWLDWVHPDAWHQEHNILHHFHTGEHTDPSLMEHHAKFLQDAKVPLVFKYAVVLVTALTWRYTHYALSTLSVVDPDDPKKRIKDEAVTYLTAADIFKLHKRQVRKLWTMCYLPYGLAHFVLFPLLFLPLGHSAVLAAFCNKLLAECLFNLHTFIILFPNHAGDDLYCFDYSIGSKEEFYVHQVLSSADYATGGDTNDHLHMWLNYQIEHHLIPDTTMLQYQRMQPEVKALCNRYAIPYVQESVWARCAKMLDVFVGRRSMRKI